MAFVDGEHLRESLIHLFNDFKCYFLSLGLRCFKQSSNRVIKNMKSPIVLSKRILSVSLGLLLSGLTFSQSDFSLRQPFYSESKVDSIAIYEVELELTLNEKGIFRRKARNKFVQACQAAKFEDFHHITTYDSKYAIHTFSEFGYFALVSFKDGNRSGITFFCVDRKFLRVKRNTNLSAPEPVGDDFDRYVMG